jgi:hypothetical protein
MESRQQKLFLAGLGGMILSAIPFPLWQFLHPHSPDGALGISWDVINITFLTRKIGELFGFPYPWQGLGWGLLLVLTTGILLHGRTRRQELIALWLPPIGIVLFQLASGQYLAVRHMLPFVPFFLFEGYHCWEVWGQTGSLQKVWILRGVVLCIGLFWLRQDVILLSNVDRPPWRDIAYLINKDLLDKPGSAVLAVGDNVVVLDYYRQTRSLPWIMLREEPVGQESDRPGKEIAGLLIAGYEPIALEWRKRMEKEGITPTQGWVSRRISPIDYYPYRFTPLGR